MGPILYPEELPISARRAEIATALKAHQVLIVAGETGSGKTTQLPKICLEAGLAVRGKIGCTQPRRVAALSVSRRVAEELGVTWGREVGCKMRFSDDTGRETQIKFMTDGILLAEIQSDPLLRSYSALILDEAHERSLNIDFLLGYLQGLLRKRGDLKLIITSATIDTEAFSKAFGGAPIIEVSGRLWPVEIRYAPIESDLLGEEIGHIEAAVRATEDALLESDTGDVLVFMPTERDIRETCELLEGGLGSGIEVIGLFGRMASADQQRIFTLGARRRVIVATNIAETSLTLPRIRYVVDAGLSRMSRYNPRTRTKRLPVEAISQSSANQRAGRAGRVQDGICIRLYDEDDFLKRPRFTQPEIQRANLAEVILRMKAFRLGEIETFPFLNPPMAAAIRAGYQLLHELGAINDTNELTTLGRELAGLPIDPTLGRMLLHAREEKALPEVLIIAAGLSVPDPRERPEDQKEAAAAAHRVFADADSDFLTILNIWKAAPVGESKGSGNALRRFCKGNFLSASRMREWRDIYRQLVDAMDGFGPRGGVVTVEADYGAIHRSILTGLIGQIAMRQERNIYKASGERMCNVFPGSNIYERREKIRKNASGVKPEEKSKQPAWIVAGEIVETSQLFARMVGGINPDWVVELGVHLCQYRYAEPHWSAKAARVLVLERVMVSGLELVRRWVDFGRIDPVKATELFIRGALVAEEARIAHRFFIENGRVRDKIETALTRVRSRRAHDLEESIYLFYAERLTGISSVHDLNRLVRDRLVSDPDFLCATEEDLIGDDEATYDRTLFPDEVTMGQTALPVTYAYSPGEEADGVTVRVPLPMAAHLTTGQLQWMVPGLREEQIGVLLRALPKATRKMLMPLEAKVGQIAREFDPGRGEFLSGLAEFISRRYRVAVRAGDWPVHSLPLHLKPRIEVVDGKNKTVASGRDLVMIHAVVEGREVVSDAWRKAADYWERRSLSAWTFGVIPEVVEVEEIAGTKQVGYLGLVEVEGRVDLRIFPKRMEAERESPAGLRRLGELVMVRELEQLWKDLGGMVRRSVPREKEGRGFQVALENFGGQLAGKPRDEILPEVMQKSAYEHILRHLLSLHPIFPLTEERFAGMIEAARRDMPRVVARVQGAAKLVGELRSKILAGGKGYVGMDADVRRLAPADFLAITPHGQLEHLPRYLRAMEIRGERAALSPGKDEEKARQLLPFIGWEARVIEPRREEFRWMLEEFRVSIFAQELGTAQPASAMRLRALGSF